MNRDIVNERKDKLEAMEAKKQEAIDTREKLLVSVRKLNREIEWAEARLEDIENGTSFVGEQNEN